MRIAVVHWSRRKIGGAERYLEQVISVLAERGHEMACLFETDQSILGETIALRSDIPAWCVQSSGRERTLGALQSWRPDVIYAHGLLDPALEERVINVSPAVFFAHNYYGTCISGNKALAFPRTKPCIKRFGAGCLLYYFPRRCGGLNPRTMWNDYLLQGQRLRLLSQYARLVVASEHMAFEYRRHGLNADVVPLWIDGKEGPIDVLPLQSESEFHLLFVGRMENLKGGKLLLGALETVAEALDKKVVCHVAGAGHAETEWQRQAADVVVRCRTVQVEFHGWLSSEHLQTIMRKAHLLVIPSIWPEPFGLVGLEAGKLGVPAAAFDVGGIRQWLHDGVNGVLATGTPPSSAGLAHSIIAVLRDPLRYGAFRTNAARVAWEQFSRKGHVTRLEKILFQASRQRGTECSSMII